MALASKRNNASSMERIVGLSLLILLGLYCMLTVFAYYKVSQSDPGLPLVQSTFVTAASSNEVPYQRQMVADTNKISSISELQNAFPIYVGKDVETIIHPGVQVLSPTALTKWPDDLPKNMSVPQFFDDSHGHLYGGSIREFLGNNGEKLITPEQAAKIGSKITVRGKEVETIYCSVASYRDPECSGTVADVFERAEYPERIRVAILDQRAEGDPVCGAADCDADPNQTLCKYAHLIEHTSLDARLSCGPVFARHLAHRHYRGEYFAMQIDSHVRFIENWDSKIVGFWHSANNEMAVLTTYLSDINGSIDPITHESLHKTRPIMCASDYEGNGEYRHLRHGQQPEGIPMIKGEPTLEPFWAAGFSFSRGHFVIQVPYDMYLPMVFQGEEISIGLRGFTFGYDYYTPEEGVCFHMYAIKENEAKRKKVPLFWENSSMYTGVGMKAMRRLNTIIGMENYPRDQWQTDEEEKYGLGKVRTTRKFFDVFGIHPEKHTVEQHLCRFVGQPMMKELKPHLRSDRMGIDYDSVTYRYVDTGSVNNKHIPVGVKKAAA
ncbi:hypothetical protein FisN_5Lh460 [Fistulifera solaris]|uniref:[Skp1-protein]-hydroxyproline N-acetylglucosaminyltransferase n=1 Tax=Fistulifera solaris TaxID=1519565 RepID=A0A1Z5KGF4_FISSO|nr:hypothetical protein FisN_5Lh460 [Fistulifera solaris]|eukprot:GAX25363.1 hypothetical protein FisN_5Lh460 [Fistulifera solaris]